MYRIVTDRAEYSNYYFDELVNLFIRRNYLGGNAIFYLNDTKLDGEYNLDNTILQFKNGLLHASDKPAIKIITSTQDLSEWWLEGKHHRDSGPAVENISFTEKIPFIQRSGGAKVINIVPTGQRASPTSLRVERS